MHKAHVYLQPEEPVWILDEVSLIAFAAQKSETMYYTRRQPP